jgi:hypothetical protein
MKQKLLKIGIGASTFIPAVAMASPQCSGASAVGASCTADSLLTQVGKVIDTLFLVVGVLAVIFLIIGGIRYITSTGDAKRIQAAKDTIFYAVAGIIVALLARAIVGFVIGNLA